MNFGTVSLAAPQAASSRVSRYSRTDRRVLAMASQSTSSDPATARCLLASAAIRLTSTAKAVRRPTLCHAAPKTSGRQGPGEPPRTADVPNECRSSSQFRDQSKAGQLSCKMAPSGSEPRTNRRTGRSTSASGRRDQVLQARTRRTAPPGSLPRTLHRFKFPPTRGNESVISFGFNRGVFQHNQP